MQKKIVTISFVIGISLLLLNIYGLFKNLRSPLLENSELFSRKTTDSITLSLEKSMMMISEDDLSDEEYTRRATSAINQGVLHYWDDEMADKFNLQIPAYENYILYFLGFAYPEIFKKYEFCKYWKKGLERGVGWCSQSSAILAQALREKGINSEIYVMSGHVVVKVQVDAEKNIWWIADPDYGVVVPYDISAIENDPEIVRPHYEAIGLNPENINSLVAVYDKRIDISKGFVRHTDYCSARHRTFEYATYLLKWIIPIILTLPFLSILLVKRKNNA